MHDLLCTPCMQQNQEGAVVAKFWLTPIIIAERAVASAPWIKYKMFILFILIMWMWGGVVYYQTLPILQFDKEK